MTKYTVEVTQEDIEKGVTLGAPIGIGEFCPVERAVARALGEPVACGSHSIRLEKDKYLVLPQVAQNWINKYGIPSRVRYGTPFSFEIDTNDAY